jgi:NTE family protein
MNIDAPRPPRPGEGVRIAIVLGAGGARGLAHIGVLEVLRERGYEVAGIAGVSMGAVVGGIHAAGKLDQFREWTLKLGRRQVLRLLDFAFGFPGLIRGDRVMGQLRDIVGDRTLESLPVPFVAVATDLQRMREVWLTRGDLFDAIRASMAMPLVFTPHVVDGRELVDGGLMTPLPIAATRQMRVDRVIAVDVNGPVPWSHPWLPERPERDAAGDAARAPMTAATAQVAVAASSPLPAHRERLAALWKTFTGGDGVPPAPDDGHGVMDLMSRSFDTMQARMTRLQIAQDPPDLLIQVPGDAAMFHEFWRSAELIAAGRDAATKALDAAGL